MRIFVLSFLLFIYSCEKPLFIETGMKAVNDTDLYYKIIGDGEPILIVHGGPGLNHQYLLDGFMPLAED
jgi:proline iminopeptidase